MHSMQIGKERTPAEKCIPSKASAAAPAIPRMTSAELLGGYNRLVIEHDGSEYHLRLTSNGKLILTK